MIRFLTLLLLCLGLCACKEEQKPQPKPHKVIRHYTGDVEVLNSCGMSGAASKMKDFLRKNGFDVVSYGNYGLQNFAETIIVLRNPEWEGAKALAEALQTDNVLVITSKRAVMDAVVYIGKDFQQIIEPDQGEQ